MNLKQNELERLIQKESAKWVEKNEKELVVILISDQLESSINNVIVIDLVDMSNFMPQ